MKKILTAVIALLLTTAFTTNAAANFMWTNTWGLEEEFKPLNYLTAPYFTNMGAYINGYPDGSFKPDGNVTTGELAQLIWNMTGRDPNYVREKKQLVKNDGHWAYSALLALTPTLMFPMENFFMDSNDAGFSVPIEYNADHKITRKEFVWMLAKLRGPMNYLRNTGMPRGFVDWEGPMGTETYDEILSRYNGNVKETELFISRESFYWVAAMYYFDAGIIKGYPDGSFKPNEPVTRAEAVTMLNRVFVNMLDYNVNGTVPDDTKGHWAEAEIAKVMVQK